MVKSVTMVMSNEMLSRGTQLALSLLVWKGIEKKKQ